MAVTSGFIDAVLGAIATGATNDVGSKSLGLVVLTSGLAIGLRSSTAYVVELRQDRLITKSLFRTKVFKYSELQSVESYTGPVMFYVRSYLDLVATDGSEYHFKALNDSPKKPTKVEAAVSEINRLLQLAGPG